MKRGIVIGGGIIAALIVIAIAGVFIFIDKLTKTAIEGIGSEVTGAQVTLDKVEIEVISGKGLLSGFRLGNPPGFKTESAARLKEIRIHLNTKSLTRDIIVINSILINSPEITYELGSGGSNIDAIQKNIDSFIARMGGGTKSAGEADKGGGKAGEEKDGEGQKLVITSFIIQNGKINLSATFLKGRKLSVPLPRINLENIGWDKGVSPGEMVQKIFSEVVAKVKAAVVPLGIGDALGVVKKGAEKAGETVKQGLKGAGDAIGKGAEGIGKALKGIFGK